MSHTFARAVLASVVAFGTLVFSAGSAVPGSFYSDRYTDHFRPHFVPQAARNARTVVVYQAPPLLTPADLHFSVEDENGVTVVRGPLAR